MLEGYEALFEVSILADIESSRKWIIDCHAPDISWILTQKQSRTTHKSNGLADLTFIFFCQAQPKIQTKASAFGWDGYKIIIIQPPTPCWVPNLTKFLVLKIRLKWVALNGSSRFQKCRKNSWLLLNESIFI